MRTSFTTIIALIITSFALAQETHTLTVKVENAKSDTGKMVFSLSTEDQFMKAEPLMTASVIIEGGFATATFENVPVGNYAVMVLHDLNGNNKMDFEASGRPTESYGVSNNSMSYGPPTWGDAKFEFTETAEITVRL
jgi:uncharacterized protein (DUF2141 family)